MPDNTITILEPKILGLNKLYRLIIEKDKIYGVYLANKITSFGSLEEIISGIFVLVWLIIFNSFFPYSSQFNFLTWTVATACGILVGKQLANYLLQFFQPHLSKIENSKLDKYKQIVSQSLALIHNPDIFLQQNKHNFIVERKEVLGVEINDKYNFWFYPESHNGQIIITAKNMTKKLLIKEINSSQVRDIFKNQSWNEF